MPDASITTVTAAVIERDGRVLICRRRLDQDHPGKWEFPGGKLEPGEQPAESLRRELREELNVEAMIGPEITRYEYRYAGAQADSFDFLSRGRIPRASPITGSSTKSSGRGAPSLPQYDFLEGDIEFVNDLAAGRFA